MKVFWKRKTMSTTDIPTNLLTATPAPASVAITINGGTFIFRDGCPERRYRRLAVVDIKVNSKPRKEPTKMLSVQIRTSQQVTFTVKPVDRFGKTEPLDGDVTATVTSGDATVSVAGNVITVVPSDVPGTSTIEITGDAQEGPDKDVLTETITIEALHDNAVTLGLAVGDVTDKAPPVAPPPAP
jgi:hypothetical protein